jgi:hypothetical protein
MGVIWSNEMNAVQVWQQGMMGYELKVIEAMIREVTCRRGRRCCKNATNDIVKIANKM